MLFQNLSRSFHGYAIQSSQKENNDLSYWTVHHHSTQLSVESFSTAMIFPLADELFLWRKVPLLAEWNCKTQPNFFGKADMRHKKCLLRRNQTHCLWSSSSAIQMTTTIQISKFLKDMWTIAVWSLYIEHSFKLQHSFKTCYCVLSKLIEFCLPYLIELLCEHIMTLSKMENKCNQYMKQWSYFTKRAFVSYLSKIQFQFLAKKLWLV